MTAQFVESPELSKHKEKGIRHGFFTRQGGVSEGIYSSLNAGIGSNDVPSNVETNRSRICAALDMDVASLHTPHQIHSNHVFIATGTPNTPRPKADGLVTNERNVAIGVVTADCGPVLFSDPQNGVIGAAHAGWRGAFDGVLENTIVKMEELGADRSSIVASLGPTISQTNYEVGPEFYENFVDANDNFSKYFIPSDKQSHHLFDLHSFIQNQLEKSQVKAELLGICTYQDEDKYFSYRRTTHKSETDYGRQLSLICMT